MIRFTLPRAARVHVLSHREGAAWVAVCGARTLVPLVVEEAVSCRRCALG